MSLPAQRLASRQEISDDPADSARAAGLRHVSDRTPGIRRVRTGDGFRYVGPNDEPVCDERVLDRIKALAIPPAWTDVWICPGANGHLQATGRDSKGRKQYRYHERWRKVRDETKYERMMAFGDALPAMRERIERDVALPGLPRAKVLATIVRLLETTLIRVGNEEYARENKSYGLTTLRNRHVRVDATNLRFHFRGKSGKEHTVSVRDRRLARIVRRCQELPGQELFQYVDGDGVRHGVESSDVNEYLREISGRDFTAKDFRTWAGTLLAARALHELEAFDTEAQAKTNVVRAIESVARRLGNTPAICRACYVHPAVIDAYVNGSLLGTLRERAEDEPVENLPRLPSEEAAIVALLRRRLASEAGQQKAS